MKQLKLHVVQRGFVILLSLTLLTLVGQASAQNTSPPAAQPPATQQTQTTQRSTTTTTQTEQAVEGVNPLWFIIGGIALLAIILIVVLASRGRRPADTHTHVSERTTVIKKE